MEVRLGRVETFCGEHFGTLYADCRHGVCSGGVVGTSRVGDFRFSAISAGTNDWSGVIYALYG